MSSVVFRMLAGVCVALTIGGACFGGDCATRAQAALSGSQRERPFDVFDATLFQNKPDSAALGMLPIRVVYAGELWGEGAASSRLPEHGRIDSVAKSLPNNEMPVVLDIEHWTITAGVSESEVLRKLEYVVDELRRLAPRHRYGYYAVVPGQDYWRAVASQTSVAHRSWQAENSALEGLLQHVDMLFPSVYTFYEDQDTWRKFAIAQVCEARRLSDKPVVMFLWPQFHASNQKLGGQEIDRAYWRLQLNTAWEYADGVVIWGGWDFVRNRAAEWNGRAPWWLETRDFLQWAATNRKGEAGQ